MWNDSVPPGERCVLRLPGGRRALQSRETRGCGPVAARERSRRRGRRAHGQPDPAEDSEGQHEKGDAQDQPAPPLLCDATLLLLAALLLPAGFLHGLCRPVLCSPYWCGVHGVLLSLSWRPDRRRRDALSATAISGTACEAAAMTGPIRPTAARPITSTLKPMPKMMF